MTEHIIMPTHELEGRDPKTYRECLESRGAPPVDIAFGDVVDWLVGCSDEVKDAVMIFDGYTRICLGLNGAFYGDGDKVKYSYTLYKELRKRMLRYPQLKDAVAYMDAQAKNAKRYMRRNK